MTSLATALARAFGQLADPAILRVLVKSILATLAIFAVLFAGLWAALDLAIESWSAAPPGEDYSNSVSAALALVAGLIGGWLLFRIVALAVIQFFADEIVLAVERRHYPVAARHARDLPVTESLADSMKGATRAILVNLAVMPVAVLLLVTGIGTFALFFLVNAWLLGRELADLAWQRHRQHRTDPIPVGAIERFLLGGSIAALLAIPVLNLLAPVIGAAAATHLVQRRNPWGNNAA